MAFGFRRWAPIGTALALAAGLAILAGMWRGGRWWSRTLAVIALVPLMGAAWASRQNIFEKMFVPLEQSAYTPATEASWVAAADPVMAVALNGEAAAYPVRQIAYHHIVQDVVGGVPIAVTY